MPQEGSVASVTPSWLEATKAPASYDFGDIAIYDSIRDQQLALYSAYESQMLPPRAQMEALENDMVKQMHESLEAPNASSILMLPAYVLQLPTGEERGSCFALDIGGTNFRVGYFKLSDERGKLEKQVLKQVALPREVYTGSCTQLFDFLANTLAGFIREQQEAGNTSVGKCGRPLLGFCFSFAMEQTALDSGKLLAWSKGFTVDGVVGQDVVQLLSEALVRAGMPCRVLALINDSVGCLAASCYYDQATEMGVILGTGTNACITLPVSRIPKWQPLGVSPDTHTAINTEWGRYCSDLLPRVKEDLELDAETGSLKGLMLTEKLMSGLYMGECARRLLLSFAREVQLFGACVPQALTHRNSFTTADLCEAECDNSPLRSHVALVLQRSLGIEPAEVTLEARVMVQSICRLVLRRSARLAASLLVSVLRLQDWFSVPRRLVVAVDGGVFLKCNSWRKLLTESLSEAFGPKAQELTRLLDFQPVADGSSFGAAVLAAAAASH